MGSQKHMNEAPQNDIKSTSIGGAYEEIKLKYKDLRARFPAKNSAAFASFETSQSGPQHHKSQSAIPLKLPEKSGDSKNYFNTKSFFNNVYPQQQPQE